MGLVTRTRWARIAVVVTLSMASWSVSDAALAAPARGKPLNLAFVLLPTARLPKAEDVARAFDRFATSKDQKLRVKGGASAKADDPLEFELAPGGTAFVALMPVPVPKGEADDVARFSLSALGTGWKLPAHGAHLVVTLRDGDATAARDSLSRFASLLAAVTQVSGAVGVYWGNAHATHDPKFFITVAEERKVATRLMLWTGVSVAREKDGRLSLLSLGMKQLGLPDLLLVAAKPSEKTALATFFDLLGYVEGLGEALPEGDTVGRCAEEKLPVHYVPSPITPNVKVWRVEMN